MFFSTKKFWKIVDFSGIRTWIAGVEGEHADRLTTPRPNLANFAPLAKIQRLRLEGYFSRGQGRPMH